MLQISENAAALIKKMTARHGIPNGGLRIGIKAGGCSGLSYTFAWEAAARDGDHVFEGAEGAKVFVDPKSYDLVCGIESRGFIFAAPIAYQLSAGFVPVRKQGRLHGPTYAQSYDLEYGTATVEVHQDAFNPGERVLIIDDVLATGGTAQATASLVRRAGADIAGIAVLIELGFLGGRAKLAGEPLRTLVTV